MDYDNTYEFLFTITEYDVDYTESNTKILSMNYKLWTLTGMTSAFGVNSADYDNTVDISIDEKIKFLALTNEPSEDVTYEVVFYVDDGYHQIDEVKTYTLALTYLKPNTKPTIVTKYLGSYVVGTSRSIKLTTASYFTDAEYPNNLAVHCDEYAYDYETPFDAYECIGF